MHLEPDPKLRIGIFSKRKKAFPKALLVVVVVVVVVASLAIYLALEMKAGEKIPENAVIQGNLVGCSASGKAEGEGVLISGTVKSFSQKENSISVECKNGKKLEFFTSDRTIFSSELSEKSLVKEGSYSMQLPKLERLLHDAFYSQSSIGKIVQASLWQNNEKIEARTLILKR